jgi:protein TonB
MTAHSDGCRETANDRFKRSFGAWLWGGVVVAAVAHFALFQLFPELTAADFSREVDEIPLIPLPEIDIPKPPEPIQRPLVPQVGPVDLAEDLTISPTTWEANPVEQLPLPPGEEGEWVGASDLVPFTVAPKLRDPAHAARIVEQHYPPLLKDAGAGGSVVVEAFVDTLGRVQDVRLSRSSGVRSLDRAALQAVRLLEFTPALNRDKKVAVWIEQRITFEVR